MNFKVILPPPHLAQYIRFFWFAEGNASLQKPFVHHAFAYPHPEFLFCYKGQFKYSAAFDAERTLYPGVYGQTQTFSKVASTTTFGIFGFYLYPHAFPQLFRRPANELTNQSIDMKALCGSEGEIFEEQIILASNNQQRMKLATVFLEERLKHAKAENTTIISCINTVANTCPEISIKSFANNNFLSVRQFERKFKELSGFNPKLYLRIMRFNSLLQKDIGTTSLTRIAYEAGYYDQAHFIHDFKKFSGYSPKEYFKEDTIAATDRGTVKFEN